VGQVPGLPSVNFKVKQARDEALNDAFMVV
jgi:hypothetical protein